MARGIHLKQLTPTDLGHLGLPLEAFEPAAEALDTSEAADAEAIDRQPRLKAVVGEVRAAVEDALSLLSEPLAPKR